MTAENLQICVGLQKTGKTWHLDWMLEQLHRGPHAPHAIVVDANREWPLRALRRPAVIARHLDTVVKEIRSQQFVLWQPDERPQKEDVADLADRIRGQGRVLVLPECHRYLPCGRSDHIPEPLQSILLCSRHPRVRTALWGDTQFISNVQRQFVSSGMVHIFGQRGDENIDRLKKIGGAELAELAQEAATRASPTEFGGRGEPGWHVTLHPLARLASDFRLRRVKQGQ